MDDVIYRPTTKEDYPQIKRILCDIWHFDRYVKSERALEVLLQMLIHSYLCAQNYTRIALRDGKIVGFLFGRSDKRPAGRGELYHSLGVFWNRLRLQFMEDAREGLEIQKRISGLGEKLMAHREGQFDGELVLFATARQVRGKGIGKKLLFEFNNFLRESGAKFIYLMSDSFCNYGFYDHLGYRRIATQKGITGAEQDGRPSEFYLYTYEV